MLTYTQWFALLTLRYFDGVRPDCCIRYQTLRFLERRGFAIEGDDRAFQITPRGLAVYNFIERAAIMTSKQRESRAIVAPLQGGGMVMFSCTSEGADVAEAFIEESRKARKVVDIQDIVNAMRESEK